MEAHLKRLESTTGLEGWALPFKTAFEKDHLPLTIQVLRAMRKQVEQAGYFYQIKYLILQIENFASTSFAKEELKIVLAWEFWPYEEMFVLRAAIRSLAVFKLSQIGASGNCERLRDLMCMRSGGELLTKVNMANKSGVLSAEEAPHWRFFLSKVIEVGKILSKHHASTLLRSTPILSRATNVHLSEESLKRLMEETVASLSNIIRIAWECVRQKIDSEAVMKLAMDFIVTVFQQDSAQGMITIARTARDVADRFAEANPTAATVFVRNNPGKVFRIWNVRDVILPWAETVLAEVGYAETVLARQPVDDEQDPILRYFDAKYGEFQTASENSAAVEALRRDYPWYKDREGVKYFGKGSKKFQSFIGQYNNMNRPPTAIPQSEENREKEVSQVKAYIDSGYSALPKQGDGASQHLFQFSRRAHVSTEDEAAVRRELHLRQNILRTATNGRPIELDETIMLHEGTVSTNTFKGSLSETRKSGRSIVQKLLEPPDVITGDFVGPTCESVCSHIDDIHSYDEQQDCHLLDSAHLKGTETHLRHEGITLLWQMVQNGTPKEKFHASLGILTCVHVNVKWQGYHHDGVWQQEEV